MGKQRGKIGKYSKISLQKKFELLKLTQSGKNSLKEVFIKFIKEFITTSNKLLDCKNNLFPVSE